MANITRWDPYRDMMTLRNAMDYLFDSAFIGPNLISEAGTAGVAIDVLENNDNFVVKASLPGVRTEDLDITYNNNVLTIKGEVKAEKVIEEARYHLQERRYGTFARSLTLPANVNAEAIKANFENGILTLILPKAEEAKPKHIAVKGPDMIEAKLTDSKN
jgi:HSP20 family protein